MAVIPRRSIGSGVLGYDPSGTITSQDVLLGNNKATYDNLQTEIATAQTNVTSLANQIIALQNEANTADETRQSEIIEQIKSLNTEFEAARADLQTKVSEANKLVSTWQATGAAVSVGDSETGLTRQITNVAAGTEDTDAVNVAQLNKLKVKVDKGWTLLLLEVQIQNQKGNCHMILIKGVHMFAPQDMGIKERAGGRHEDFKNRR